ncbi:nuclear transport factor 2 family protein [Homoserinibacter sp. YIM 151385]|uniref:nuclear transport factor 2 family protein n=1 Tax=Homoserinibacter sp. YIM 151385 TaxID=2985506 RepID=UPI0022F0192E|nr:nuclear transport factor 2 family protein [Homoserinibacter sp. YIM 151385]WBU38101.1 nuclear transport factor 2 family protein [Homoserinibacter sp. YIM 151385]
MDAEEWVARYVRAWRSNDADDIRGLFTEDAEVRTDPWKPPTVGHDAIVAEWLGRRDEPGSWGFEVGRIDRAGDRAFIEAETRYPEKGTVYSNLWVVDLAPDGRAVAFTEWWMDQADPS